MPLIVRHATLEGAADILAIYNFAALNTTAVWNGPSDLEARRDWIRARGEAGYPVLVAMRGSDVVGFACFGDFRPWPGYRHGGEFRLRRGAASPLRDRSQSDGSADRTRDRHAQAHDDRRD